MDEAILLPLALLNAQQHALGGSISVTFNATHLGYAQARAIGHAERRPIFYAGGGGEKFRATSSGLKTIGTLRGSAHLPTSDAGPDRPVPSVTLKKNRSATTVGVDDPRAHMGLRRACR